MLFVIHIKFNFVVYYVALLNIEYGPCRFFFVCDSEFEAQNYMRKTMSPGVTVLTNLHHDRKNLLPTAECADLSFTFLFFSQETCCTKPHLRSSSLESVLYFVETQPM